MSQTDQTTGEITDSLTGHEESWIFEQFGSPIGLLANRYLTLDDPGPFHRALLFILKRREGVADDDARNQVMSMTLADVLNAFPERSSGGDEPSAEVVEESGKGESEPEPSPRTSLSSVS